MSDQLARTGDGISPARGTAGYADTADVLAVQYEEVTFDEVHSDVLQLVPVEPGRILDVGAGTGRDAAALAAQWTQRRVCRADCRAAGAWTANPCGQRD
ncbi:hypothetical protein ACFYW6_32055 [Streptomyces sp. NPDC002659]|uniref:hypothetical protein n=1 Tax=Streptomyces sp. NPDC002659 TaxID=3364656 RepID=UPI0036AFB711